MLLVELLIHGNRGTQPVNPKTNLEVGLQKPRYVPKRNRTTTGYSGQSKQSYCQKRADLARLLPNLRKGKSYKKTSLVVCLGTVSYGLH